MSERPTTGRSEADRRESDRLDCLLSVDIDGELDPAEREELDRLLVSHPEAPARRARLESVDAWVRAAAGEASDPQAGRDRELEIDRGLREIRSRIARPSSGALEASNPNGPSRGRWAIPLAVAAAAALVLLFAVPRYSSILFESDNVLAPSNPAPRGFTRNLQEPLLMDDAIALALVFELDEEANSIGFVDPISAEDLEIIERLDLLEYLAARESGEHG